MPILRALFELIAEQEAAAGLVFVDAYAISPKMLEALTTARVEAAAWLAGRYRAAGRPGIPNELPAAVVGGIEAVVRGRLVAHEASGLTELAAPLAEWAMSYPAPPGPLRRRIGVPKPVPFDQRQAASSPAERVLRGLAAAAVDVGMPALTVKEICARAKCSQRAFYEHFENLSDAVRPALDFAVTQMLASAMPAYRRSSDWPTGVRAACAAMLGFAIQEPELAALLSFETYAGDRQLLAEREAAMKEFEQLLAPGFERRPEAPWIVAEAIVGALGAVLSAQRRKSRAERTMRAAPFATYLALAPFVGAEAAYEVATA